MKNPFKKHLKPTEIPYDPYAGMVFESAIEEYDFRMMIMMMNFESKSLHERIGESMYGNDILSKIHWDLEYQRFQRAQFPQTFIIYNSIHIHY